MSAACTLLGCAPGHPPVAEARVRAAVDYVGRHPSSHSRVVFTGGWAEVATGAPEPAPGRREADLMAALARDAGLHTSTEVLIENRSRSTLENLLHVVADGLLHGRTLDARHPLGLVSHAAHLPRVRFLAGKVLGLRGPALLDIPVPGAAPARLPPAVLLLAARLGYLGANDRDRMLRRERMLVRTMSRIGRPRGI